MRFVIRDGEIEVVLSRRNLLAGLHKLDMPGSAREIQCEDGKVSMDHQPGPFLLRLHFEDDAEHYNHPERQAVRVPGPMHPDTEAAISPHVERIMWDPTLHGSL